MVADCRQSLADASMLHGIGQCCPLGRPRGLHLPHSSASGTASLGSLCCFGVGCLLYYRVCKLILTLTCVFGCYLLVYWFAFYLLVCLYTFVLLHTCVMFTFYSFVCLFTYVYSLCTHVYAQAVLLLVGWLLQWTTALCCSGT